MGRCSETLALELKKIALLYKYFLLIFVVQDQRSGFHLWESLQRIKKAKIENDFFSTAVLIGRISGNS